MFGLMSLAGLDWLCKACGAACFGRMGLCGECGAVRNTCAANKVELGMTSTPRFAFTESKVVELRTLLTQRQAHSKRCSAVAATTLCLTKLVEQTNALLAYLACGRVDGVNEALRVIESMGFVDAGRVLKGAAVDIVDKATFVATAHALLRDIKHGFEIELRNLERPAQATPAFK